MSDMSASKDPGPRQRLIASAQRLTATQGVGVGVDAILEDASVARRSLYQHFGGKDALIAESLRESAATDEARYVAAMDAAGEAPRDRILAVIDGLDLLVTSPRFRGCPYVSAEVSLPEPGHPAHAVIHEYTRRLQALFTAELTKLGHRDPEQGAAQILVLIDGILVVGALLPGSHPGRTVRPLVESILDS